MRLRSRRSPNRSRPEPAVPRALVLCLLFLHAWAVAPLAEAEQGRRPFRFAVLGDMPYTLAEEIKFPKLIDAINSDPDLSFVVHVGDFKSGGRTACSDEIYQQAKSHFDRFRIPVIYTPGDNEWTDCHRASLGGFDPQERLAKLREIFFPGEESLGQRKLPLKRQSRDPAYPKYRENARWIFGTIAFATLHIVGSNNNLGRDADGDREHRERMDATLRWMSEVFAIARHDHLDAVVLILHANPFFEKRHDRKSGFRSFLLHLEREVAAFRKPVLLVHGDTHTFRLDAPLHRQGTDRPLKNFARLETFGSPLMDWVKVLVDAEDPNLFYVAAGNFPSPEP